MSEAMQLCSKCGHRTGNPSAKALANTSESPQTHFANGYMDKVRILIWQWCMECNRKIHEERGLCERCGHRTENESYATEEKTLREKMDSIDEVNPHNREWCLDCNRLYQQGKITCDDSE